VEHAGDVAGALRALDRAGSLLALAEPFDQRWAEPIVLRGRIAGRMAYMTHEPREVLRLIQVGMSHVDRALALDEQNAEAYYVRAALQTIPVYLDIVHTQQEADSLIAAAVRHVRRAVALNPRHAEAANLLSELLYEQFDLSGAARYADQAYAADAYLRAAPVIIWRLYSANYDEGNYAQAERWCMEGEARFPDHLYTARCRLWIMTMLGARADPDSAWPRAAALEHASPPQRAAYFAREGQIIVAAVIGRAALLDTSRTAALLDSARNVLVRARAGRDIDPRGDLIGYEAFARALIGDHTEAVSLLDRYLTAHPDHRRGFGRFSMWWWDGVRNDPRFRALSSPGG
jgi:tetratricopeptide (TPR) repeat protein